MRYGISAFSMLLSKQEPFALFKLPWLTLIESLHSDSRPSKQLKVGLPQMYLMQVEEENAHLCAI